MTNLCWSSCLLNEPSLGLFLGAQSHAHVFLSLDLQNIAMYEWLPSFLKQTPPEYPGEGLRRGADKLQVSFSMDLRP